MAAMLLAGPYCELDAESTPIVREVPRESALAARLGRYCSSSITCCTRALVDSRMLGWLFSTRETVWCDTPARRATSRMLGARLLGNSADTGMASIGCARSQLGPQVNYAHTV
jgi:hypothetical protein